MRAAERGALLLEVLAAVTILALVAPATIALLAAAARQEGLALVREAQLADAERVLGALTLLTRDELVRGVGTRRVGEFTVEIRHPRPVLFRVNVSRVDAPTRTELATVVYRAEPAVR